MTPVVLPSTLAAAVIVPGMALAETSPALDLLLNPVEPPMLTYALIGRSTALSPADVFEIQISESGGITDVFIRLGQTATTELDDWTTLAVGTPMSFQICGAPVMDNVIETPIASGTFYVPNLSAQQAEALRAVWQGRETCSTLAPEVFPFGQ